MSINPLLNKYNALPAYSEIQAHHVEPAVKQAIAEFKDGVTQLLKEVTNPSWQNFIEPLMDLEEDLSNAISPIYHLASVRYSDDLQEAVSTINPLVTDVSIWSNQHPEVYDRVLDIAGTTKFATLSPDQQRVITLMVKSFEDSGVDLTDEEKRTYNELQTQLSDVCTQFSTNCIKSATDGWFLHIQDVKRLDGLSEYAIETLRAQAEKKKIDGFAITLQPNSVAAVLTKAHDRELRREVYNAYVTTASNVGPDAGKWNNEPIVDTIVDLKTKIAQTLGFADYVECSLDDKMAQDGDQVLQFINDLIERVKPDAKGEYQQLQEFAEARGVDDLQPWDNAYFVELMRETYFSYNEDEVREYFTCDNVIEQMLKTATDLYGVTFEKAVVTDQSITKCETTRFEDYPINVWDPNVHYYHVYDQDGEKIAGFYLDLFARDNKRSGAWMKDVVSRRVFPSGIIRLPVASLNCNFNPPSKTLPSMLTMSEIETLFHEFGHGLHHMLTEQDYPDIAGISNVAWDAVELPSQFMEHFCWHKSALRLMGKHYKTGNTIPDHLITKLINSQNFRSASAILRQLEFSLFDMEVYGNPDEGVANVFRRVNSEVAVKPATAYNRSYTTFKHIMSGGYSAGYYSYLWAEVLSSHVFSFFEQHGNIFSRKMGTRFLDEILSKGGSEPFEVLFFNFTDSDPDPQHLLRHRGL